MPFCLIMEDHMFWSLANISSRLFILFRHALFTLRLHRSCFCFIEKLTRLAAPIVRF